MEIYKEGTLFGGTKYHIIKPNGLHFMRANYQCSLNKDVEQKDFTAFFMREIIFIDDKQIAFDQLEEMSIDDILMLIEIISSLLTPLKNYY